MKLQQQTIDIEGARVHNLKNLTLSIPREKLVVITGLSGSGKSSLAFDTIYAEGQRRYMETFSAYVRQFLGNLERPEVDKIDGLSPVIAIEQKTTSKNPRSTVGTITELYDFIRLLFARVGTAYSYHTNERMVSYADSQIIDLIQEAFLNQKIALLAPLIKSRKGHYRELFDSLARQGFNRVRVDGEIMDLKPGMKVDRYKTHDIDLVIDRLKVTNDVAGQKRIQESIDIAMRYGDDSMLVYDLEDQKPRYFSRNLMCPSTGISYPKPEPNTFSFNSPKGMCDACKGLGTEHVVSLEKIIPDPNKSINQGGLTPLGESKNNWAFKQLENIAVCYQFSLNDPIKKIPKQGLDVILNGGNEKFSIPSKSLGITRDYVVDYEGIINFIKNQHEHSDSMSIRRWASGFMDERTCPECAGSRLKKEALFFKIDNKNIADISSMDLVDLYAWFDQVTENLNENERKVGSEVIKEIKVRLQFLLDVGLNYLTLNRSSKSLSGGEAQRIRLATQIGSQLVGVLYILDEPSIGLHQRDNQRLIQSLAALRDIGNSVIVVEHDKDMILAADHVLDIGPMAGIRGGQIVAQGTPEQIAKADSLTAQYLNREKEIPTPKARRKGNGNELVLEGCTGNNLKNISVRLPLGLMIGVTGVSGSGKSTLINETLYPILNAHFFNGVKTPLPYQKISGLKHLDKVVDINQSPIGRTPRSNPATYCGVFSEIRTLFTKTPEAQIRGYKPGRFSFNVKGGRCETCQGGGMKVIEMNFLPDVYVECETCQGKRFNRETLEIRYKGKPIADVLEMNIAEACDFFESIPKIYRKLKTIKEVGLGYIALGQSSTTLSGGEAQRIKLASELSKKDTGQTIYILDEPTTGLHFEDIRVLMEMLNKLVDRGNTVLIIEHNLDVIRQVDYLIDIGPEGGKYGGEILACGTPEEVIKEKKSHTAVYLSREIDNFK
ncbi:MAG: excinuclease ABC subunit UvrA [Bacteroidetes bacterium]|nr:excinuclease ABC subunit UvrA [Bacteroidota bacterium]MDA0937725.1 excinuclease ABC subunit UvrA [Bacteroidota bacterium]MDA1344309.1 excinuclease ABC subunit UvrA [Bacteroidota bacterium]